MKYFIFYINSNNHTIKNATQNVLINTLRNFARTPRTSALKTPHSMLFITKCLSEKQDMYDEIKPIKNNIQKLTLLN